jgi:hypothetical protein
MEQTALAESARVWNHDATTAALLAEASRRNLGRIGVKEQRASGYLGTNRGQAKGIRLSPAKTKGFGPFKKTFHFDINLNEGEIVGGWIVIPEAGTISFNEVFRLPINDTNIADSINRALTFIASKT